MKKSIIAIVLMLTLSLSTEVMAQKHRHTPRTEQVDSTKNNSDAIEAYSDTTATDSFSYSQNVSMSDEQLVKTAIHEVFSEIDGEVIGGFAMILGVVFILFVILPIIVLIGVVLLINRNRREKYKLAQMAIKNGQPIPEQLLKEQVAPNSVNEDYNKGMRQLFLGLGLMIFLGYTAGQTGFGIGALVFCIGLGKVVIAKTSMKNSPEESWNVGQDERQQNSPSRQESVDNNSNNPSEL